MSSPFDFKPGVYEMPEAEGWTVEGVARCPGCGLYFDVKATLPELENFTETHDCAKEETRYMPWQL